jgi:hypothetical protein
MGITKKGHHRQVLTTVAGARDMRDMNITKDTRLVTCLSVAFGNMNVTKIYQTGPSSFAWPSGGA